jgi:hypothetical protein
MECLGEVLWRSQRDGTPIDGQAYIDAIHRKAAQ